MLQVTFWILLAICLTALGLAMYAVIWILHLYKKPTEVAPVTAGVANTAPPTPPTRPIWTDAKVKNGVGNLTGITEHNKAESKTKQGRVATIGDKTYYQKTGESTWIQVSTSLRQVCALTNDIVLGVSVNTTEHISTLLYSPNGIDWQSLLLKKETETGISLATNGTHIVFLTSDGYVHTAVSDASTWDSNLTWTSHFKSVNIRRVVWDANHNKFRVVSNNAIESFIIPSADSPIVWESDTAIDVGTPSTIIESEGVLFALGTKLLRRRPTDTDWSEITVALQDAGPFQSIATHGDTYMLYEYNGSYARSLDAGSTWKYHVNSDQIIHAASNSDGTIFVATTDHGVWSGSSWDTLESRWPTYHTGWTSLLWSPVHEMFFLTEGANVHTSTDGHEWAVTADSFVVTASAVDETSVYMLTSGSLKTIHLDLSVTENKSYQGYGITKHGEIIVTVGNAGAIIVNGGNSNHGAQNLVGVASNGTTIVVIGANQTRIYSEDGGTHWLPSKLKTEEGDPIDTPGNDFTHVYYVNDMFVNDMFVIAQANSARMFYSLDGISWHACGSVPERDTCRLLGYIHNSWVHSASDMYLATCESMTTNQSMWTVVRSRLSTGSIIERSGDEWIQYGENSVAKSENGISWSTSIYNDVAMVVQTKKKMYQLENSRGCIFETSDAVTFHSHGPSWQNPHGFAAMIDANDNEILIVCTEDTINRKDPKVKDGKWVEVHSIRNHTFTCRNTHTSNVLAVYDDVVIAVTDGRHMYRSKDCGLSWTPHDQPAVGVRSVNFFKDALYILTPAAIFKSHDKGDTWPPPTQIPRSITRPSFTVEDTGDLIVASVEGDITNAAYRLKTNTDDWTSCNGAITKNNFEDAYLVLLQGQAHTFFANSSTLYDLHGHSTSLDCTAYVISYFNLAVCWHNQTGRCTIQQTV